MAIMSYMCIAILSCCKVIQHFSQWLHRQAVVKCVIIRLDIVVQLSSLVFFSFFFFFFLELHLYALNREGRASLRD